LKSDGDTLSVRSISDDKNVLGEITVEDIKFPAGEFGVYETKKLRSILSVLDENLTIKENVTSGKTTGLNITDGSTKATFVLADATVIPVVPELKKLPPMDVTVILDEKFINTFIKAKGALSEVDTFTVIGDGVGNSVEVVIGHSNLNTNRINVTARTEAPVKLDPISFSANFLREILNANKEINTGTMQVSSKGLSTVKFEANGFTSVYYLVQMSV
jgi:hypothetical protein